MRQKNFIVYRRVGDQVTAHRATLVARGGRYHVVQGAAVPWAELYAGHTGWVADRINATRQAIQGERAKRDARKAGTQAVAA